MDDIQVFVLKGMFENLSYFRKVSNNLEERYFELDKSIVLKFVKDYFAKYQKIPDYSVAMNSFSSADYTSEVKKEIEETLNVVKTLDFDSIEDGQWLYDKTKEFANERAMFLFIKEGAMELNKEESKRDFSGLEAKMREALSINWDEDLGIDYFDEIQFDEVYDWLSNATHRIPLGIGPIDNAICGGIPGKTKFCGVLVGSAGLGKSMILSNIAVNAVKSGKNVLYLTFEIDQKELRKRMDAAFTDLSLGNIFQLRNEVKRRIIDAKQNQTTGRFIIKEFPPASISALQVETFVHTLNLKKKFVPDILILDYLGIMTPISPKSCNSLYEKGKSICEEIRALSDRLQCPIISASQTNRTGYGKESVELDNIADSMGIAHTSDLIISLVQTDELKENNQIKFEIIKSRISKDGIKGMLNIDYDKLKIMNKDGLSDQETINIISKGLDDIKKTQSVKNSGIT